MPDDATAVTREVKIEARPETVFSFLTDPKKLMRWKGVEADLEPRPGGAYRVNVTGSGLVVGEFVEVEPNRRVVFTWGWDGNDSVPPGSSTVEITLVPDGDHTILRLTHSGLPTDEERAGHATGWEHYLARLVVAAAGGDPGVDPWTQKQ